jgi:hypothetical protein
MTGHSEVQKKRPPPQSGVPPQSSLTRPAQLFETSIPGIFAIGDLRCVSIERQARAPPVSITCIRRFAPDEPGARARPGYQCRPARTTSSGSSGFVKRPTPATQAPRGRIVARTRAGVGQSLTTCDPCRGLWIFRLTGGYREAREAHPGHERPFVLRVDSLKTGQLLRSMLVSSNYERSSA